MTRSVEIKVIDDMFNTVLSLVLIDKDIQAVEAVANALDGLFGCLSVKLYDYKTGEEL